MIELRELRLALAVQFERVRRTRLALVEHQKEGRGAWRGWSRR
jgi:hypothetical protein